MSQPGPSATPFGQMPSGAVDTHEYAMWDAAYVLGSLSPAERREFETHMGTCKPCRQAVAEISGMPALLSRLDKDDVAAIDEHGQAESAPEPPARVADVASGQGDVATSAVEVADVGGGGRGGRGDWLLERSSRCGPTPPFRRRSRRKRVRRLW